MKIRSIPALAVLVLLPTSCLSFSPLTKGTEVKMPGTWAAPTPTALPSPEAGKQAQEFPHDWWVLFSDPTLTELEKAAEKNNLDLKIAQERLAQARAQLGVAEAAQFPSLGLSFGAQRGKSRSSEGQFRETKSNVIANNFSLSGLLSYELDLFGKNRNLARAARAAAESSEFTRDVTRLEMQAMVAEGYFNLRALDAQIRQATQTVEGRRTARDLRKSRFAVGETGELDYRQAEGELAEAEAILAQLTIDRGQAEHALMALLGGMPVSLPRGRNIDEFVNPPPIPPGIPSDLLVRRPDVASAERLLEASNARIQAARAAFFPTISLTGVLGYLSPTFKELLDPGNQFWTMGARADQPLFAGGRNYYSLSQANAQQRELVLQYQSVVQTAFFEVGDALIAAEQTENILRARKTQVVALRKAVEIARARYQSGESDHLELLDAERSLFTGELDVLQAYSDRLVATIGLFKALGGGWKTPNGKATSEK